MQPALCLVLYRRVEHRTTVFTAVPQPLYHQHEVYYHRDYGATKFPRICFTRSFRCYRGRQHSTSVCVLSPTSRFPTVTPATAPSDPSTHPWPPSTVLSKPADRIVSIITVFTSEAISRHLHCPLSVFAASRHPSRDPRLHL